VAGSVATAADKTARTDVKTDVVQAPGSARAFARNIVADASTFGLGGGCSCTWFNGAFDPATGDGQVSHLGGAVQYGAKAADDFYLCEGFVYDIDSITVTLLTTSIQQLTKSKLEIYADCDGCPSDLLYTLEKSQVQETGATFGVDPAGTPIRIVNVTFRPSLETKKENQNIVLKGGAYWISAYGLTDGQCPGMNMCDVTYWATSNGPIKGKVAKKADGIPCSGQTSWGQYCFGDWRSVEECCVGCTDLAFTVCARECKILHDNGEADRTANPAGSLSQFAPFTSFDARSADDFVVPPCDPVTLCYIEGCVYTNCDERFFKGYFEIYGNDCKVPAYALAGTQNGNSASGPVLVSAEATKVVYLGYSVVIDGRSLRAYRLEFHDLSATLNGGAQYWISIGVKHTFSANERAYFCYNTDCDGLCLIHWNSGQYLARPIGMPMDPDWVSLNRDFSFLVAVGAPLPGGGATPACTADFDRNGSVNIDDIFGYLNAWFTGCP
jgi:hypothetical protein